MSNLRESENMFIEQSEKKEVRDNQKKDNSFYQDNTNKDNDTKWTQDWRGKTLGLFLASSILIGAAIPAGMAISGYFNRNDMTLPDITKTEEQIIKEGITVAKNRAVEWQFDKMMIEGSFPSGDSSKKFKTTAEKNAKKTIQDKIDSLKREYGSSYQEELDKYMSDNGWKSQDDWKSSLISEKLRSRELEIFTGINTLIPTVTKEKFENRTVKAKYFSKVNSQTKKVRYIENLYINNRNNDYKESVGKSTLTAEKLMNHYIDYYQPILFNDSLLQFTPIIGGESEEANLKAGGLSTNVDEIFKTVGFYEATLETNGFLSPGINYNGIQSASNIDLGTPLANVAIYNLLDIDANNIISIKNLGTNSISIQNIIKDAFGDIFPGISIENLSKSQIDKMTSEDINSFENNLRESLKKNNIILDIPSSKRNISLSSNLTTKSLEWDEAKTQYKYKDSGEQKNYIFYLAEDGLHMTGIQSQGKGLVVNFLDFKNNVDIPTKHKFDNGLFDSFKLFIETEYNNIILGYWITSLIEDGKASEVKDEIFEKIELSKIKKTFYYSLGRNVKNNLIEKTKEADDFYSANWEIFDYDKFIIDDYFSTISRFSNINKMINGSVGNPAKKESIVYSRRKYE